MRGRLYLSYTSGDPWVLTWGHYRRTFATLGDAQRFAKDNNISYKRV